MSAAAEARSAETIIPAWVSEPRDEATHLRPANVRRAGTFHAGYLGTEEGEYLACRMTTPAMEPAIPTGLYVVFHATPFAKPVDGDVVVAHVQLWPMGISRDPGLVSLVREFCCIRKLERSNEGEEVLAPLAPGFPGYSAGRRDGRSVYITILGVATPHRVWAHYVGHVEAYEREAA